MKNPIATLMRALCVSLLIVLCASHAAGESANYVAVEVRKGSVFIEGKHVTRQTTLSEYQTILGKADRVTKLFKDRVTPLQNTIYTYDELGILLYQRPGEETVLSISLDLVKSNYEFSAKKPFQGIFIIDSQVLRQDFPQSALRDVHAVQIDPTDKTLTRPVTKVIHEKIVLILKYLSSRKQLEGVGISWETKD